MWMTIASLHLFAVVGVALWTKSKFLTWIAGAVVLVIAFAKGSGGYDVVDAISTLIGLGIGLSMVPKHAEKAPTQRPNADIASVPTPSVLSMPSPKTALAREFELRPSRRRYPIGRWVLFALAAILGIWALLPS